MCLFYGAHWNWSLKIMIQLWRRNRQGLHLIAHCIWEWVWGGMLVGVEGRADWEWGKSGALPAVKGPRAEVIPGWASTEWSLQSLCPLTLFKGETKRIKKTYYFESSPYILLFYLSPLPPTCIFISPKTVWDDNTATIHASSVHIF